MAGQTSLANSRAHGQSCLYTGLGAHTSVTCLQQKQK